MGHVAGWMVPEDVLLHASRSGQPNDAETEYHGTVGWVSRGTNGFIAWNATAGPGLVSVHLDPWSWGWNARGASDSYYAIEIAQANLGDPIDDETVLAVAWIIRHEALRANPDMPLRMPTHAEIDGVETGAYDGKTDPYRRGDPQADELRARIRAALERV